MITKLNESQVKVGMQFKVLNTEDLNAYGVVGNSYFLSVFSVGDIIEIVKPPKGGRLTIKIVGGKTFKTYWQLIRNNTQPIFDTKAIIKSSTVKGFKEENNVNFIQFTLKRVYSRLPSSINPYEIHIAYDNDLNRAFNMDLVSEFKTEERMADLLKICSDKIRSDWDKLIVINTKSKTISNISIQSVNKKIVVKFQSIEGSIPDLLSCLKDRLSEYKKTKKTYLE